MKTPELLDKEALRERISDLVRHYNADEFAFADSIYFLVQSQKQAHGELVVGENETIDPFNSARGDNHERQIRNMLRGDQRERNAVEL